MNIKKVYFAKVVDICEARKYNHLYCRSPHIDGHLLVLPVHKDRATIDELHDLIESTGGVVAFVYEVVKGKPFPVLLDLTEYRGDYNG